MTAKVFGPALSIDAKKSIGKAVTFQGRPKGTAVMKPPIPSRKSLDQPSLAKCNQRTLIGLLVIQWQFMSAADKAVWETEAKTTGANFSGYHAFIKKGIKNLLKDHGLAGFWSFNEASGEYANDISGNGQHLTLGPSYPSDIPGRAESKIPGFGNALYFDGADDTCKRATSAILNVGTGSFTILLWMRGNGTADVQCLVAKSASNIQYQLTNRLGTLLRFLVYDNAGHSTNLQLAYSLSDNNWHFIAAVCDRSDQKLRIYHNGAKDDTETDTSAIGNLDNTGNFNIGHGGDAGLGKYKGNLDGVRLYKRALTAQEINRQYYLRSS